MGGSLERRGGERRRGGELMRIGVFRERVHECAVQCSSGSGQAPRDAGTSLLAEG